jgi:predicted metal-dependent hydrolase
MSCPEYALIRSARRTLAIQIRRDGLVQVRAPLRMPTTEIHAFVLSRQAWINKHLAEIAARRCEETENVAEDMWWHLGEALPLHMRSELQWQQWQREQALELLPARCMAIAKALGPRWIPTQIKLRRMRSRWGSCSLKGDITFNTLLMHMPLACIDYVIYHELCHLHEFHHGPAFYALQSHVNPDWPSQKKALTAFAVRIKPL